MTTDEGGQRAAADNPARDGAQQPDWSEDGVDGWAVAGMDIELDATSQYGVEVRINDAGYDLSGVRRLRDVLDTVVHRLASAAPSTGPAVADREGLRTIDGADVDQLAHESIVRSSEIDGVRLTYWRSPKTGRWHVPGYRGRGVDLSRSAGCTFEVLHDEVETALRAGTGDQDGAP